MTLPPGPRSPTLVQTARWWRRPVELLEECGRRFGDLFTLRLASLGDVVLVSSPELVKQVFTADPAVLCAGQGNELLRPLLGRHSVLLLDGAEHVRHRRLLMPPFVGERMAVYAHTMQKSTLAALRSFPVGRPFSLHPAMQEISLDVILHAIFGLDDGPTLGRFAELLLDLFRDPPSFLLLLPPLHIDAPLSPYRRFIRARKVLDCAIYQLIDERRHAPDLAARSDILSLLLSASGEAGQPLSDEEVHDELMTMMVAGHETSSTALAWTFERILSEPSVLERALAEVQEVQDVGPASLAKLQYIDAIVKETLRLRPIIPAVARTAVAPFALAGYEIPAGTAVWPCIHLVQRRAEIYPEPERFRPERFLDENAPDTYTWVPFGGGTRRCLGASFALMEMRVVLARVLERASLRPASPELDRVQFRAITLAPRHGVQVALQHAPIPAVAVPEPQSV